jgi:hypothetical protein
MEGQSVVLRAEKGRLRLSVEAENDDVTQEVVYNLNEEGENHGEDGENKEPEEETDDKLRGNGEVQGSPVGMDGEEETGGDMPGTVDPVDGAFALAKTGDGGDAAGAGAEGEVGQGGSTVSTASGDAGEEAPDAPNEHGAGQTGKDALKGAGNKESRDVSGKRPEALRGSLAQS